MPANRRPIIKSVVIGCPFKAVEKSVFRHLSAHSLHLDPGSEQSLQIVLGGNANGEGGFGDVCECWAGMGDADEAVGLAVVYAVDSCRGHGSVAPVA